MNEKLAEALKSIFDISVILLSLGTIAVTVVLLIGMKRFFRWLSERYPRYRVLISGAFPIIRLVIWIVVVIFVVSRVIHPDMQTLVAISASIGVAVGLGAQELVKSVLSGIVIIFERPFRVGDLVRVKDHYGEVTHIGLRSTRLHTFDDSIITIPNGLFINEAVNNSNYGELDEQVIIEFTLPATAPVRQMKELMQEAAMCSPYVHRGRPVIVLIEDLFDHGFLTRYHIKAYVVDIRMERVLASDIVERIKEELNKRDILPSHFIMVPPARQ